MKVCTYNDLHAAMPGTSKQIAERLGVTRNRVTVLLRAAPSYITDWVKGEFKHEAVYALGEGVDVLRPPPWAELPYTERKRIIRERRNPPKSIPLCNPSVERTGPANPFDMLSYTPPPLDQVRLAWLNREL